MKPQVGAFNKEKALLRGPSFPPLRSRPHPGPALAPCFPSVLLQLEEADTGRDLEQHFAMFSLALKSDRTNLIERVGRTFSIMF